MKEKRLCHYYFLFYLDTLGTSEVCKVCNISARQVNHYRNGSRAPSPKIAARILLDAEKRDFYLKWEHIYQDEVALAAERRR